MKITDFVKMEFCSLTKWERIVFPPLILLIVMISFYLRDDKISIIYAICGICYTILAGKGKIYCYIFGLVSTLCYSYISFKNGIYGNFALNLCYYFPMQLLGIFVWKNHLKKASYEIKKTRLASNSRIVYIAVALIATAITGSILKQLGDSTPFFDSVTTVFSILGLLFTIKRCIEQWYVWTLVNGLAVIMWTIAYINGSHCIATILTWLIYFILGLYFLNNWKKELRL